MGKMMKTTVLENRYQQLGHVYRLIEQFELISRSDLAKLANIAPASMTSLTKWLIDNQFVMERASQNLPARGRPAVGLSLSPFYWHFLCFTISEHKITLCECDLNGMLLYQADYAIKHTELSEILLTAISDFYAQRAASLNTLFALSISVIGKISTDKTTIFQLGKTEVNCPIIHLLRPHFSKPILLNEHFQLWFLAESVLGNLIRHNDVIYLQLDEDVNLSVRLKGALLHQDEHKRMNVDKMIMPRFSHLSDEIGKNLSELERYQLKHQITFSALTILIDHYLPHPHQQITEKIQWFCECVEQNNSKALQILDHLCNNLAYMLMNLINLFSIEKVMFNSPLLRIKKPLFDRLQSKLQRHLLVNDSIDLVTSQYDWDSIFIPSVAIKLGIYEGALLKNRGLL